MVVLPRVALSQGMLASYAVAGVIGMPIAFYLRTKRMLHGGSIHLAACVWACVFASLMAIWFVKDNWLYLPLAFIYFLSVLSGKGFGFLVQVL